MGHDGAGRHAAPGFDLQGLQLQPQDLAREPVGELCRRERYALLTARDGGRQGGGGITRGLCGSQGVVAGTGTTCLARRFIQVAVSLLDLLDGHEHAVVTLAQGRPFGADDGGYGLRRHHAFPDPVSQGAQQHVGQQEKHDDDAAEDASATRRHFQQCGHATQQQVDRPAAAQHHQQGKERHQQWLECGCRQEAGHGVADDGKGLAQMAGSTKPGRAQLRDQRQEGELHEEGQAATAQQHQQFGQSLRMMQHGRIVVEVLTGHQAKPDQ